MAEQITLHQGDSAEVLKQYPDNYFDSIVTDPPYGIEFLSKEWDKNTGPIEVWRECLRVLKPGGHILAFSAARTYHRLATNLEDIGFEIRDQLQWIYGSGFPKGQDMGKLIDKRGNDGTEYRGWKTGLKPAHEPIVMARKPFKGSTVDNVIKHGTGAINIDDTRVGTDTGRYPSNVIMSEQEGKVLDEKTGIIKAVGGTSKGAKDVPQDVFKPVKAKEGDSTNPYVNEPPKGASKYFYCPKVSRKERNMGFDLKDIPTDAGVMFETTETLRVKGNNHPTVKPVALMKYLVTLVTPKGGKVLDPFNGSGSTGMAVKEFGGEYTGIDLDPNYIEIATKRIEAWK